MMIEADMATTMRNEDIVYGLAAAGNTLYAARGSGLYCSHDAGVTWVDALTSLADHGSLTVTAVAAQGNIVLAGVKGAVLCSQDAAETFTIVGLASPPPDITALAISPSFVEDGIATAGTADDGVFITTDRGASWVAWNFGLVDAHVFALAFSPVYPADHILLAGTESGVFVSKNGGRGWNELDFPMEAAPVISLAVSPTFAEDGFIYAGTEANGLWVSSDRGENWQRADHDRISGAVNTILTQERHVYALLEEGVVQSADAGQSWTASKVHIPYGKLPMTMSLHPANPAALILGFVDGDILPAV